MKKIYSPCPIFSWRRLLFLVQVLVTVLWSGAGNATQKTETLFIMPPRHDLHVLCKTETSRFDPAEIEKLRQRSLPELSPDMLLRLAEAYSSNKEVIVPDYPFALAAIEQVLKLPYHGGNQQFIDDALFLKYDLLYKGKAGEERRQEASPILDRLISRNHAKAHRRYGEMQEDEERFPEAADSYKKAIIGGDLSAYFSLARLYSRKESNASPAEFERALSNLQQAVLQNIAKGNCKTMVDLARFYGTLDSMEEAKVHSIAWYEKAATAPIISAKLNYAQLLIRQGEEENWKRAAVLWKEAAALGSVTAMRQLGDYYLSDQAFDPAEAGQWLQKAAARKDAKISVLLQWAESLRYKEPPPYPQIIAIYERAAAAGHADAWYRLGRLYQYDIRDQGHLAKAINYYQKAAAAQHVSAMQALQAAYSCNIGVGFQPEKAEFWQQQIEAHSNERVLHAFSEAASNDFAKVTPALLRRLETLAGMPGQTEAKAARLAYQFYQDDKEPVRRKIEVMLRQGVEEESDYEEHAALGALLYDGTGKDYGLKLLELAAGAGNISAQEKLGDMYATRRDYSQAIAYYEKIAQKKDSARRKLYYTHVNAENISEAVKNLRYLAGKDDVQAMLNLAVHYYKDLQDMDSARYWFTQTITHYPCESEILEMIVASYLHGENGAPVSKQKAAKWLHYLHQIPLRGYSNPIALARTLLYQESSGNNHKRKEALEALISMSEEGNQEAGQALLDYYLLQSDGKQLVAMLARQARNGSIESMIYLSNLYLSGFADIDPDKQKSIYWLEQAKKTGDPAATARLVFLSRH